MKIVIDARMYGLEHAGIGRYVMNLVREIAIALADSEFRIEKETTVLSTSEMAEWTPRRWREAAEFYLLVIKSKFNEIKKEVGDKFKLIVVDAPHYSFKEQTLLPIQLFKLKPDLVHFPHFNVPVLWWGKQVVTIHDLIKHESRGMETTTRWRLFYWFKYLNYRFLVWLAVKRAAKIIVPSKWWKKELIERYGLSRDKVVVTYEGVDERFQIPNSKFQIPNILRKYGIKRPFVIYTGSLYPHKNVERLVRAVALLGKWTKDTSEVVESDSDSSEVEGKGKVSLVIVCARNVFYERFKKKVKEMGAEEFVNLVGFVPDEELIFLYQQAEAFIFPSLLEGFGLPGLEAMACGCPVVSSNASCLPEIYGKAALYFNPMNVGDMVGKIERVIDDSKLRKRLKKLGFEQVKKYSWQKTAQETLEVYKEALYV